MDSELIIHRIEKFLLDDDKVEAERQLNTFAKDRALKFSKFIQNIPLFYNTEKQAYQNIFGEQHFTEHELYLDFLTTLNNK
jgi:hypothetical protein